MKLNEWDIARIVFWACIIVLAIGNWPLPVSVAAAGAVGMLVSVGVSYIVSEIRANRTGP